MGAVPSPTEPANTKAGRRLNPVFVEWMMGLQPGWVTGHGLKRNAMLRLLGNGVVPQQGAAALRLLLEMKETV
jgi:DNA (cytosine-5)-methyltransferase 1